MSRRLSICNWDITVCCILPTVGRFPDWQAAAPACVDHPDTSLAAGHCQAVCQLQARLTHSVSSPAPLEAVWFQHFDTAASSLMSYHLHQLTDTQTLRHLHNLPPVRLRSHWYEYEFRVQVSVYGSYKLHPYEWSVHGHYTSPHTSTRVYRQSPVGLKSNRENALRKKLQYTTTSLIIQLIAHLYQWIIKQWRNLWRKICVIACINYFNTNFALFTPYGLDKNTTCSETTRTSEIHR